jgi:hypothetical protein
MSNTETLAMEFLKELKPNSHILNIREGYIGLTWINPSYTLDGLFYDQTENSFYILSKENFSGSYEKTLKVETTSYLFRDFVNQEKPLCKQGSGTQTCSECRKKIRRWSEFFDEECGIIIRNNNCQKIIRIFVFTPRTKAIGNVCM